MMVRFRFLLALAIAVMAFTVFGCDDEQYYGGSYEGCPITVPFPDGDNGNDAGTSDDVSGPYSDAGGSDGESDDGSDDGSSDGSNGSDSGDDGEQDDGEPANGQQCEVNQYTVCHFPGPNDPFTICVGNEKALNAHLDHGDYEGSCE